MESQQKEKQRTSEKERTQNSSTLIFSCVTLGYLPNFLPNLIYFYPEIDKQTKLEMFT